MEMINELKSITKIDRLSEKQSIMAIRLAIKAEIDAVHLYELVAESTENEIVREQMLHLIKEEKTHIGELLRTIREISHEEFETYEEGAREFEEEVLGIEPEEYDLDDSDSLDYSDDETVYVTKLDLDSLDQASFESMLDGVEYKGKKRS